MRISVAPDRLQGLVESRPVENTKRHPHLQKSPCRLPSRSFVCQSGLPRNEGAPDKRSQEEKDWLQICQGQQEGKRCSKSQVSTIGSSLLASALTCTGGGNGGGGLEDFGRGGGGGGDPGSNSLFELAAGSDQEE